MVSVTTRIDNPGAERALILLPGLGESIFSGVGGAFHEGMAAALPHHETISIATDGVDRHYPAVKHASAFTMATRRRTFLQERFGGETPLTLVGTSLGTIVANQLLVMETAHPTLNIEKVVYYAPALLPNSRAPRDMLIRFPVDGLRDIITDRQLGVGIRTAAHFIELATRNPKELPGICIQAVGVLEGTREHEIQRVASHFRDKMHIVSGTKDTVAALKMWQELKKKYPGLTVEGVPGKGHTMTLDIDKRVRKITKALI
jgi:pimeloyl-ACP methyl ester carboxylesterase